MFKALINKLKPRKPEISISSIISPEEQNILLEEEPESSKVFPLKKQVLDKLEVEELLKRIAHYHSTREIEKWMISIGKPSRDIVQLIYTYRRKNEYQPIIEKYRKEFAADLAHIPLANKVKRVMELNSAFERLREQEDNSRNVGQKLACIEKEAMILSKAQGELEGKIPVEQTNFYITQFNSMTKEQREQYKFDLIERIKKKVEGKYAGQIGSAEENDGDSRTSSRETLQGEQVSVRDES